MEDAVKPAGEVTPVEKPESPEPENKEGVEAVKTGEEATLSDDPSAQPKKKGVGKRIDELVRQREDERREKEYWRTLALQKQGISPEQDKKEVIQGKPDVSKFDSYDAYLDALADWKVDQRLAKERENTEKQTTQRQQLERLESLKSKFDERAEKFREKHDDFDIVAFDESLPVSTAMTEAILDSDLGPEIMYHLGNNPKESARIFKLSPYAAAREIGKLELQLKTTPKRPSNAPDPINPVGSKEKVTVDPDKLSVDEWMKRRNQELRKS